MFRRDKGWNGELKPKTCPAEKPERLESPGSGVVEVKETLQFEREVESGHAALVYMCNHKFSQRLAVLQHQLTLGDGCV